MSRAHVVSGLAGAFLVLHLLVRWGESACAWGLDSLAYPSIGRLVLFAGAAIVILLPSVRSPIVAALERLRLDPWRSPRHLAIGSVVVSVLAAALFFAFRSAIHLLGDGLLHLNDLELLTAHGVRMTEVSIANFNAPLSTWLAVGVHRAGAALWSSPETTYRLISIGCGAGFFALALGVAGRLGDTAAERFTILALTLTGGYVQVFAGYVETYAPLLLGVLAYAFVAFRSLAGAIPIGVPAFALGILVPMHFSLVTLLPSLAAIAFLRSDGGSRTRHLRIAGGAMAGAAVVTTIVLVAIRFDVLDYLGRPRMAFLPWFSEPNARQAYGFVSWPHLLDVLNQYALVAPAAFLALPFLRFRSSDPRQTWLLIAAAFPVLFTLIANPEVGAFRDWDAFSFAAVPTTLWAGVALVRAVPTRTLSRVAFVVGAACAIHSLAWIDVNAGRERAERRFQHLLETCAISRHARSYGWESLGSLRLRDGRSAEARLSFVRAAEVSRDNPRLWVKAGELSLVGELDEEAIRCFSEALSVDPEAKSPSFVRASFGRGAAHFQRGEHEEAIEDFRRTVEKAPDHFRAHYNLGLAYLRRGRTEEAIASLRRAVDAKRDFAIAHETLGSVYRSTGRDDEAVAHLRRALELDPRSPRASEIRRWLEQTTEPKGSGE